MDDQLELPLWETLKSAASILENADLEEIWFFPDATMVPLDTQQQLQVAGDAITQIAQSVQQQSLLTLEEIQSAMQQDEPVVLPTFLIDLCGSQYTQTLLHL